MERSRDSWKEKYMQATQPVPQYRKTIQTPEQDVRFTVAYNLTIRRRKKMKTFFRSIGVDFFAIDAQVVEFVRKICNPGVYLYDDLRFPKNF